jgi:ribonuclease HI
MPWIEAMLRGEKVLARAKADGSLADEGGRVEIRYKPNDGRAYRAARANLAVSPGAPLLPDDACGPASAPPQKGASGAAGAGGASAAPAQPAGRAAAHAHPVPADAWQAFTDGACSGNPGPAGSGVVLVAPGGKLHEGLEYLGEATNNVAELTAILRALEWIPPEARGIVVHTDSKYAIGVLTKGWKAKANPELIARTRRLVESRGARLEYVPGHQGVPLNERADSLAREAVQTRRSRAAISG